MPNAQELKSAMDAAKGTAVIWDVDHLPVQAAPPVVARALPPRRTFALSDKTLNRTQAFAAAPFAYQAFQHNLIRKHDSSAGIIYSKLIESVLNAKASGLKPFFGNDKAIKRITLKASTHRTAAVQAVENFLQKSGFNPRMAAKIAQAADELLVNAIFDAAVDRNTGGLEPLSPMRPGRAHERDDLLPESEVDQGIQDELPVHFLRDRVIRGTRSRRPRRA